MKWAINTSDKILLQDQSNYVPTDDDPEAIFKNSKIIVGDIISHIIFGKAKLLSRVHQMILSLNFIMMEKKER
ncbi:hypothetical protein ONA00_04130 [Mycoplasmopsis cynos]|uniref:hypothetical protein n=1 Tax=Mycoplasmopsis cynos TaxID=171284 RepID=UPI0024C59226|nr:hypothetical protein [Mycoplasmopsis cynos]WAM10543.1 hypothetical protein ONA00_04130 [Mycoplasmopsis cynos]